MDTLVVLFGYLLAGTRFLVGVAFLLAAAVALTHWAVRNGHLEAFSPWPKFVRKTSDPILNNIEGRLLRAGGNPQHAPFWLMGGIVVGGLVLIEVLKFLFSFVLQVTYTAQSGAQNLLWLAVDLTFRVLMFALLVRVFSSWFGAGRYNKYIKWSYQITDWLVEPIRRVMPTIGVFDLSPMVAYMVLLLARGMVF